jgi:phosphoenolpyruvate carboxykinase (ATP)
VPGVDAKLLNPVETWDDPAAFDKKAHQLAAQFVKNFEQYADMVPAEVLATAPDPAGEEAPDFGAEG